MKNIKKLLALVLALAICAAFALPAVADETTYKLTLNNAQKDHTYVIYQLFSGTPAEPEEEGGNWILSNIEYGSSNWTMKEKNAEGTEEVVDAKDAAEVISAYTTKELDAFVAGLNYNEMASYTGSQQTATTEGEDLTWDLPGGYYLIRDVTDLPDTPNATDDVISAIMVRVVGATSVTPKTTETTSDKQATDKDGEWSPLDAVDHAIGEEFKFKIIATVSAAELPKYETKGTYTLQFNDTFSSGITFGDFESLTVLPSAEGATDGVNIEVIDSMKKHTSETFTVAINLLDYVSSDTADDKPWPVNEEGNIVVELVYTATLNENAVIYPAPGPDGLPNWNNAYVEFSRDPYTDDLGETEEDRVYVYTFKIDALKIDGAGEETEDENGNVIKPKLAGAGFTLYKYDSTKDDNLGEQIGEEVITTDTGEIKFSGLKQGDYVLVETTTPTGYDTMKPMIIHIKADYVEEDLSIDPYTQTAEQDGKDVSVEGNGNVFTYELVNNKGSGLPSTGGIGTTIFYTVGAILVVGAGVLLFTKRRMSKG